MSLLDQLQTKKSKLSHVAASSAPKEIAQPTQLLCENSADYWRLMTEALFENWYEAIRPLTFASSSIPLPREAASALISEFKRFSALASPNSFDSEAFRRHPSLVSLADQIDSQKKTLSSRYIFVRLSTRSPKDAVLFVPKFKRAFEETLAELTAYEHQTGITTSAVNRGIHALYCASTKGLALETGAEAIGLLSRSKRIQDDLETYVQQSCDNMFLVVREFATFEPEFELRAFVYNRKLTALTQYNDFNYFPRLVAQRQSVAKLIDAYIQTQLLPLVPNMSHFIIDFVLISKTPEVDRWSSLEPVIIEINPMGEFAGSGLFSWTNPTDRDVLLGKREVEFRVRESTPPDDVLRELHPDWTTLITQHPSLQFVAI